jgi:uncharacterized phage protein (TIGR01671 family)
MREILFRGKSAEDGKWFTGQLLHFKSPVSKKELDIIVEGCEWDDFNEWCNIGRRAKVVPETIGQYTGLTDKNCKMIFDGDIVQAHFRTNHSKQIFRVTFDDGMFIFNNGYVKLPVREIYGIKVIGNIHDNPELLKGDIK